MSPTSELLKRRHPSVQAGDEYQRGRNDPGRFQPGSDLYGKRRPAVSMKHKMLEISEKHLLTVRAADARVQASALRAPARFPPLTADLTTPSCHRKAHPGSQISR
ncbi:hypothetical protein KOW79_003676 [Hemibagrus wyckioides]|uniref:Uncharacterized protein n=1 Tax=Hemibagrus wyckioides TaxID=337641 RepID=A0A9D3P3T5_9TELE|nr:hypothetical protein KOW79_003676 [Hemibagrus wyckioides]